MTSLGVNIDHIATVRQLRGTAYPDIAVMALEAVQGGADSITVHLREDRRHIQLSDVIILQEILSVPLNLEMANVPDMVNIALRICPAYVCLVPERRAEVTTEHGLDVVAHEVALTQTSGVLGDAGMRVSFFVDPRLEQIDAAARCGASAVELHTGDYANADDVLAQKALLSELVVAAQHAHSLGLMVHAGHGLSYENLLPILTLPHVCELNIGHSIVARALSVGLSQAVFEMKSMMTNGF